MVAETIQNIFFLYFSFPQEIAIVHLKRRKTIDRIREMDKGKYNENCLHNDKKW